MLGKEEHSPWDADPFPSYQPVMELSQRVHALNQRRVAEGLPRILVHTDAAQMIGKGRVDVQELGVDYLTIVGHKVWLCSRAPATLCSLTSLLGAKETLAAPHSLVPHCHRGSFLPTVLWPADWRAVCAWPWHHHPTTPHALRRGTGEEFPARVRWLGDGLES